MAGLDLFYSLLHLAHWALAINHHLVELLLSSTSTLLLAASILLQDLLLFLQELLAILSTAPHLLLASYTTLTNLFSSTTRTMARVVEVVRAPNLLHLHHSFRGGVMGLLHLLYCISGDLVTSVKSFITPESLLWMASILASSFLVYLVLLHRRRLLHLTLLPMVSAIRIIARCVGLLLTVGEQVMLAREVEREREERRCVVCQDDKKAVLLLPCRHLCTCDSCWKELLRTSGPSCPVCRQEVREAVTAFI